MYSLGKLGRKGVTSRAYLEQSPDGGQNNDRKHGHDDADKRC